MSDTTHKPEHEEFVSAEDLVWITPTENLAGRVPRTARQLLDFMISRQRHLGSPLPDGFVAPPGIDLDALLKQLPPRPETPPPA